MSIFWTIWITTISLGSIVAILWLIHWTQKPIDGESKQGDVTSHSYDGIEEYNNPMPRWWLWLFYIAIIFALIYYVLYGGLGAIPGVLGWSQTNQYEAELKEAAEKYDPIFKGYAQQPVAELAKNPQAMETGKRLFLTYCSICHGSDARGDRGFPNLADNDWLYGNTNIKQSIMQGREGAMPAFRAMVGDQGVSELTSYVYSLNGRKTDELQRASGEQKFKLYCVACHGMDAKGNQQVGAPNLTDKIWLYGGSLGTIQETIRNGRNGKMPSHKAFLGNDKSHVLAAYVFSLSNKTQGK